MRLIINSSFSKLALVLTFYSSLSLSAEPPPGPNILFILPDQWRTQAFGFAGDPNANDRFGRPIPDESQRELKNGFAPTSQGGQNYITYSISPHIPAAWED
jgi:hypothetical protein